MKQKTATLDDLYKKTTKLSGISSERLVLAEINGDRIVNIISVINKNKGMKVMDINLRSGRIFAYEIIDSQKFTQRMIKEPKMNPNEQSMSKHKFYKSIQELKLFEIVDAQDYRGAWYRGIVMGPKITKHDDYSMKIHFVEFDDKWDEFYDDENLFKVAPAGTYAEEPASKDYTFIAYHRIDQNSFTGIPFIITLSSEMTWDEAYEEIVTQASRYITQEYYKKFNKSKKLPKNYRLEFIENIISTPPFSVIFVESSGKKCFF